MLKKQAIKLYKSGWWKEVSDYDKVKFQLFEKRLCMPFDVFHGAVERVLGRPVFTHEFGMNVEGLRNEFLKEQKAPTFEEIVNLIPEDKRMLVVI
jgi:hypothetical protein